MKVNIVAALNTEGEKPVINANPQIPNKTISVFRMRLRR